MAVRRRAVRYDPRTGVVDPEVVYGVVADALTVMDFCGGVISITSQRAPTDVPGEMVTTAVVVEWKDRTDAKPQPESPAEMLPAPQPGLFDRTDEDDDLDEGPTVTEDMLGEEVDESAVPEALRG